MYSVTPLIPKGYILGDLIEYEEIKLENQEQNEIFINTVKVSEEFRWNKIKMAGLSSQLGEF